MRTRTAAPPIRTHVAANVRAELARAGISQAVAASWIGVTQPAMSARLHARVPFTVDEIAAIAAGLDLPVTVLFGGMVDPTTPAATGTLRNRNSSLTPQYVLDWSEYARTVLASSITQSEMELAA